MTNFFSASPVVCRGVLPVAVAVAAAAEYSASLAKHDWHFEFSEDSGVWARGNAERKKLKSAQKELDADYVLWNKYAPNCYQIGLPV